MTQSPSQIKWGMVLILITSLVAFGFGMTDFFLYQANSSLEQKKLPRAKKEYKDILSLKSRVKELKDKIPPGANPDRPNKPEDLLNFFETKLRQASISKEVVKSLTPLKEGFRKHGPWKEYSYSIVLRSTSAEKIRRESLVVFLFNIEYERPFLKTKDISISQLTPQGDVESAQISVSYFNRE